MVKIFKTDICIIGGGAGGLTVAAAASQLGANTILIEKNKMGGDCLHYGCVPSKALLASGSIARSVKEAESFGVAVPSSEIIVSSVFDHIKDTIAAIEPNDSEERFEGLGVRILKGIPKFFSRKEVRVGEIEVRAKKFVIATGSSPSIPSIPGLNKTKYLTNETIFEVKKIPRHLVILGGGPTGVELAQAYSDLGAAVTIIDCLSIMNRDDPELVGVLRSSLLERGITIFERVTVKHVESYYNGIRIKIEKKGVSHDLLGSHLLVCAGRRANIQSLELEVAGVECSLSGIKVNQNLQTTNRKIFAIGDVLGDYQFTHVAAYHASIVIKNILFRLPSKFSTKTLPRVTYTSPELAQVGIMERDALLLKKKIRILRSPYFENDRARTDRKIKGLIKIVCTTRGKILGAGIVGASAGELIQVWILAIQQNLKIGSIASLTLPYPTLGEISKKAAGSFFAPSLFSDRVRKLVKVLLEFRI